MEQSETLPRKIQNWTIKYTSIVGIGLSAGASLTYLYKNGYRCVASGLTLLGIGGAYAYWKNTRRIQIPSGEAIVITGCDSGLGYSLALHCHALGATVIAGVLRCDSPGARDLRNNGIEVHHLDLTDERSVVNFAKNARSLVVAKKLALRALVNNAGVMIFGEFEWQTEEQTRSQIEVNVLGTMRITKQFMPMIRENRARIIVVSSHCASAPLPGVAAYAASKAALSAWATSLRVELVKYGVEVVCFVPGEKNQRSLIDDLYLSLNTGYTYGAFHDKSDGSFTKDSNLLAQQDKHFEAMASTMTNEAKQFYGEYFTRYSRYLSGFAREMRPHKLLNPLLYRTFEGALLDVYPKSTYICEPWRYTFYHVLFKIAPTSLRDSLVEKFMMMPKWTENSRSVVDSGPMESLVVESSDDSAPNVETLQIPAPDETVLESCESK